MHTALHLSRAKSVKCRTAVFLRLLLWEKGSPFVDDWLLPRARWFFSASPWMIANDIRTANLGWCTSARVEPKYYLEDVFVSDLLSKMHEEDRCRTDDVRLQACTSLLVSHIENKKSSLLKENSHTIEGYLGRLFQCFSEDLVETASTTLMATANALAYGALAVFLSDKYETKVWKNSRWELGLETTGRIASVAAGASAGGSAGSTVTGVVKLGTTALSKWFQDKQQKLLKVVYSVARKFELQVLREAEEGRLRDMKRDLQRKSKNGKPFAPVDMDDYIHTASVVFNIVVAETKVPLSIEVAARPKRVNDADGKNKPGQDMVMSLFRRLAASLPDDAPTSSEANPSAPLDDAPAAPDIRSLASTVASPLSSPHGSPLPSPQASALPSPVASPLSSPQATPLLSPHASPLLSPLAIASQLSSPEASSMDSSSASELDDLLAEPRFPANDGLGSIEAASLPGTSIVTLPPDAASPSPLGAGPSSPSSVPSTSSPDAGPSTWPIPFAPASPTSAP